MPEAKLTALAVRSLSHVGYYNDGAGLYLRVGPDNRRSWLFRFKRGGRTTWLGLGSVETTPLAEARQKARQAREALARGDDPLEARKAARAAAEAARGRTFEAVAGLYIEAHRAGWKNPKHAMQWEATLRQHVYPTVGAKPVAAINVHDVMSVLGPIWHTIPETASRVRGRIEAVLDHAGARGWRFGDNPAAWRGRLAHLLPAKTKVAKVEHHAALPWRDLPSFMAELAGIGDLSALALRFTVLTAGRTGEVVGARWSEIDLAGPEGAVWTVPAVRMKAGKEHRVPLSSDAIIILEEAAKLRASNAPNAAVFPGRSGGCMSNMGMAMLMRRIGRAETVHGCRSTFRIWCAERTSFPREVCELALAHTNKDRVESAYQRSDLLGERRRLMDAWSTFATRPAEAAGGTVTAIRAAG